MNEFDGSGDNDEQRLSFKHSLHRRLHRFKRTMGIASDIILAPDAVAGMGLAAVSVLG